MPLRTGSLSSRSNGAYTRSPGIAEFPQIGGDGGIEPGRLGPQLTQLGDELPHRVVDGLRIALLRDRADVAAGRQNVVLAANLRQRRALAEARHVGVGARAGLAAPGMVGARDPADVGVRQLPVRAVRHPAEVARVNEEHAAPPVAELVIVALSREEP